jgi:hypothetical protein
MSLAAHSSTASRCGRPKLGQPQELPRTTERCSAAIQSYVGWQRFLRFREIMKHRTMAEVAPALGIARQNRYPQVARIERELGQKLCIRLTAGGRQCSMSPLLGRRTTEAVRYIRSMRAFRKLIIDAQQAEITTMNGVPGQR